MKEDKVLYQIKSLAQAIMRTFLREHKCIIDKNMKPPTATQHQIMQYIIEHCDDEIYQKDLENILNLRRATVSGVLQTMEKNNLIERVTNKNDTRSKKIILNEDAKKIFLEGEEKINDLEKIVVKDISPADLIVFSRVINKMKENIKNNTN